MKTLDNKFTGKPMIVANDKAHLLWLIKQEIVLRGNKCSLNHIDISKVTDISHLFDGLNFQGDISEWDVSNIKRM